MFYHIKRKSSWDLTFWAMVSLSFFPLLVSPAAQSLWGCSTNAFPLTCYRTWSLPPSLSSPPLSNQTRESTGPRSMFQYGSDLLSYQHLTSSTVLLPLTRRESQASKYIFFPFLTWLLAISELRFHWTWPCVRYRRTKNEWTIGAVPVIHTWFCRENRCLKAHELERLGYMGHHGNKQLCLREHYIVMYLGGSLITCRGVLGSHYP